MDIAKRTYRCKDCGYLTSNRFAYSGHRRQRHSIAKVAGLQTTKIVKSLSESLSDQPAENRSLVQADSSTVDSFPQKNRVTIEKEHENLNAVPMDIQDIVWDAVLYALKTKFGKQSKEVRKESENQEL